MNRRHLSQSLQRNALLSCAALLSGCGIGNLATPSPVAIPALHGHVMGGQQPLTGTTIKLYAVGYGGNGSAAADLLGTGINGPATSVSSGADGSFSITGDYACPILAPSTPVYLTATGGNPGLLAGTDNTAIALVAALGPCDQLLANAATTYITINEATTAAAAWALAPFATSLTDIGATPTNLAGITQAFAIANQLVDTSLGTSPNASVASYTTVESAKLYSLADVLAFCVNTNGTDGHCTKLFTDAKPPTTLSLAPTDTFATALDIVQNPSNNVAKLFGLIPTTAPFPALGTAPNDWTMSVSYTLSSGPLNGFQMGALDSSGDLVGLSTSGNNYNLASFNRQFSQQLNVPLCPDGNGYCYGALTQGDGFAIDSSGDLWVDTIYVVNATSPTAPGSMDVGPFSVSDFNSAGTLLSPIGGEPVGGTVPGSPAAAGAITPDSDGAVWVASGGDSGGNVAFLDNAGDLLSPESGYGSTSGISPVNIAVDGAHTAWVASWGFANEAGKDVSYPYITSITNPRVSSPPATPTITRYAINAPVTYAIAVDPTNNVWFTSGSSLVAGFSTLGYIKPTGTVGATAITGGGLVNGVSAATDSGNHLWIANFNPTTYVLTLSEFSTASGSLGTALSPSSGYGLDSGVAAAYAPDDIPGLIIDSSGSLWLPNSYQNQAAGTGYNDLYPLITVFVGLATPTKTPLLGLPQAP